MAAAGHALGPVHRLIEAVTKTQVNFSKPINTARAASARGIVSNRCPITAARTVEMTTERTTGPVSNSHPNLRPPWSKGVSGNPSGVSEARKMLFEKLAQELQPLGPVDAIRLGLACDALIASGGRGGYLSR